MAKNKKSKAIQKKRSVTDCHVKLKRLDRETIERYLNRNPITHNNRAKICHNKIEIEKTNVASKNNTFNVVVKLSADELMIKDSNMIPDQVISGRILRPKLLAATSLKTISKPNHKSDGTVGKLQTKSIAKMVDQAWRKCKTDSRFHKYVVHVDDIVMAKLKGHTPWPAIVIEIMSKARAKVQFFGVQETEKFGFVNIAEIAPFTSSIDVIQLNSKRNISQFNKAVQEALLVCDVPSFNSMLSIDI